MRGFWGHGFVTSVLPTLTLLLTISGCTGNLQGDGSDADTGKAPPPPGDVKLDDLDEVNPESLPDGVPPGSRVLRLGYAEYDRTLSDLLHLDVNVSSLFPAEPPGLGAYEDASQRAVNERLLVEYSRAAEELAERLVTTPDAFAASVGCAEATNECRDSFIDRFGLRAYRRPLTDAERLRLVTLFDQGAELVASGDALRDGVQLVVEAVLQSPKFLYRIEEGRGAANAEPGAVGVRLTDYEVASRLSYLLWGTLPDDELLAAAAAGELSTPEGIELHARRLAEDPRISVRVLDFHERWMQLNDLRSVEKDNAVFPGFTPELVDAMRAETRRFVEAVTLEENGAVLDLLTAPFSYVDADLAALYGLSGSFGAELQRVDLPAESGRMGLLTQPAFLTGHSSSSTRTSPILRGVFILDRLACQHVPPPPPGAEMEEPDEPAPDDLRTTRDFFAWKTSMPECASCHRIINPVGFGFEQFDGIGQFRTSDNDAPVDSSGSLQIGDHTIDFDGARDLILGLSELGQVRACYATHWLTYFYGRSETEADLRTLASGTQNLASAGYGVRDLLVDMTRGAAFSHLPPLSE